MSNQVDLSTKTTPELKAIAYDVSEVIQEHSQILNVINAEIQKRKQQYAQQKLSFPPEETNNEKAPV